ncbi:MAG TPA: efflux RND transporter periplasmic adaptor subunit [Verrucomicrobiae bacterium]|nr:efflux RND transporter periplasmic adaptor subunit [Verrucomicrobiae bacterium]
MKFVLALLVVAGVSAGGYYLWSKSPGRDSASQANERITTATVEPRSIRFGVTAAGDIGPADQVSVRPEINGRILELPVDIGDKVPKDALLCRLDDRDLQIEKQSREAEVDGAKLALQKAQRTFLRNKKLFTDNLISQEIFEDSRTEFDLATNGLSRSQSALRLVEDRLLKTKILAPFDCTVLTRPVSIGQAVSGSAGFNSGTEVMSIANLSDMIITAHVNQADVIRLTPGQEVEVNVESVPGLEMTGRLDRVAPQAVIKNGIKGFAARVAIKNIDSRVRPGMTAILNIPVSSAENVLSVPLSAVFSERSERYVFVKEGDSFVRRPVVVGLTDFFYAEVQQGLSEGETVSLEQVVDSRPGGPPPPPPARKALATGSTSGGNGRAPAGAPTRSGAGS